MLVIKAVSKINYWKAPDPEFKFQLSCKVQKVQLDNTREISTSPLLLKKCQGERSKFDQGFSVWRQVEMGGIQKLKSYTEEICLDDRNGGWL